MTDKQTVKFGDICREVKLTTKDSIADGYERYIGLEHLDSGSLKIKRWGMIAEDNPSFTRVFKKGHILFGKRRPYLKKAAIAEFDGVCSGDIIVMESTPDNKFPDFLPFLIQSDSFWKHAISTSSGSLSPRTKFKSLQEFSLTLGDEQSIQRKLGLLVKCEEIRSKNNQLLEAFDSLFSIVVSDLLRVVAQDKPQQVPKGWQIKELCELAEVSRGKFTPRPRNNPIYYGGSTPFLQTGDVGRASLFIESHEQTLNEKGLSVSKLFPKGTIFLTIAANIGDVAMSTYDVACTDSVVGINPKDGVDGVWLLFYLKQLKPYLDSIAPESAQKNINLATLRPLKVATPSYEKQVLIGQELLKLYSIYKLISGKESSICSITGALVER
ncbi:restriction endonuclease subunit S [Rheinheimera hassiensis]|uniref:restriction endonuclease subunit S n=1 Tax=Rheinheimera hassiensis TaxID=1193627 RepID=UPI001F06361F|nr:restriction endonuclease subunit S [Rheinheimera hassiensis]